MWCIALNSAINACSHQARDAQYPALHLRHGPFGRHQIRLQKRREGAVAVGTGEPSYNAVCAMLVRAARFLWMGVESGDANVTDEDMALVLCHARVSARIWLQRWTRWKLRLSKGLQIVKRQSMQRLCRADAGAQVPS
jgi:hypothetical protein